MESQGFKPGAVGQGPSLPQAAESFHENMAPPLLSLVHSTHTSRLCRGQACAKGHSGGQASTFQVLWVPQLSRGMDCLCLSQHSLCDGSCKGALVLRTHSQVLGDLLGTWGPARAPAGGRHSRGRKWSRDQVSAKYPRPSGISKQKEPPRAQG